MLDVIPWHDVRRMDLRSLSTRPPGLDHGVYLLPDALLRCAVQFYNGETGFLCCLDVLPNLLVCRRIDFGGVENVVLDAHDCAPVEILDEEVLEVAVGAGPDGFELLVLAPCEKSVDDEWIVFARTEGASPDDAVVTGLSKSYCSMSWRVTPDGEFLFDPSCVRRVAVLRDEVDEGSEVVGSCIRCGRHVPIRGAVAILLLSHDMHVVAADKRHKVERGDVIRGSVKN